ncbi:hypothetical protein B0T11DRAFT_126997 [Plectosphaerella cucumerina]|uniref:Uncharacterized protein n=1 Tax=Plectosphaerella cucumerina TaxID=40658 RepID=A0A8K0TFE8_9PEZI|nr:hypothetical protein B0T11DRAFT_126997 [Plectosphaerella cucumerina]
MSTAAVAGFVACSALNAYPQCLPPVSRGHHAQPTIRASRELFHWYVTRHVSLLSCSILRQSIIQLAFCLFPNPGHQLAVDAPLLRLKPHSFRRCLLLPVASETAKTPYFYGEGRLGDPGRVSLGGKRATRRPTAEAHREAFGPDSGPAPDHSASGPGGCRDPFFLHS